MNICRIGWICLLSSLFASEALSCRYTVRDTGFVDLGTSPYLLYLYLGEGASKEMELAVKSHPDLPDSNIKVEWVRGKDHPAMKFLPRGKSAPAASLVAPDGRFLPYSLAGEAASVKEALTRVLDEVTSSPLQVALPVSLLESFAVVLVIEGEDASENEYVKGAATRAVDRIKPLLGSMAKPMKRPPLVIVLPFEKRAADRIPLWSLGATDGKTARAAVLYGKGRRIGPLLEGESLSEANLYNLMRIIGADCECGLDRAWLRGLALPLAWGWNHQEKAAKELGFDPENPMVKMEVSQIIGMAGVNREAELAKLLGDDLLDGYTEEVIEFDPPSPETAPEEPLEEPAKEKSPMRPALFTIAGTALLILVGVLIILVRVLRSAR